MQKWKRFSTKVAYHIGCRMELRKLLYNRCSVVDAEDSQGSTLRNFRELSILDEKKAFTINAVAFSFRKEANSLMHKSNT